MAETGDIRLITLAIEGQPEAFGVFFRRHANVVYNYLFRRTGSWSEAEDLTSVVFLEAWRRRDSLKDLDGSLVGWLLGVATNVLRNHRRAQRRHQAALDRLGASTPIEPDEPDFSDDLACRLVDEASMRNLLSALGHLSRRDQDVLALCVWQGLSYEEAAVALDVPVGTVRSRLSRARTRAQAKLHSAESSTPSVQGARL